MAAGKRRLSVGQSPRWVDTLGEWDVAGLGLGGGGKGVVEAGHEHAPGTGARRKAGATATHAVG